MSDTPCLLAAFAAELPPARCRRGVPAYVVGARPAWAGRTPPLPAGDGPVLVVGACGGLVAGAPWGRLVVPALVVGLDGQGLRPDPSWAARLSAAAGPTVVDDAVLAEAERAVDGPAERSALAARTSARFVDLETAPLARAAAAARRPWAALRWVTDTPDRPLAWLARLLGGLPETDPSLSEVLAGLARQPWLLPALVRLGRVTARGRRAAGEALVRALTPTEGEPRGV